MPVLNCDQVFVILTRGPFPSGEPTDDSVEAHLITCMRCRRFAEALRADGISDPELLHPEESRDLPYYWGIVAVGSDYEREMEAEAALLGYAPTEGRGEHRLHDAPLSTQSSRRRRRSRLFARSEPLSQLNGWQLLFAVIVGAALGTVLRLIGYSDESRQNTPVAESAADQVSPSTESIDTSEAVIAARFDNQDRWSIERQLASKLGAVPSCWHTQQREQRALHAIPLDGEPARLVREATSDVACCTRCHNATSVRFALRSTTAKVARSCQVCHHEVNLPASLPPMPE
jgi:hypothetical protein